MCDSSVKSIWVTSEGPPRSLFLWEAWCRVQFNLAGLNQHLKWANSSFEVNSLQSLHFWSSSNLEVVFFLGGKRSEWVKVRELRKKPSTSIQTNDTWITRNAAFCDASDFLSPRIPWRPSVRPASVRQGWGHHASVSLPAGEPGEFPWFYMRIWRRVVGGGTVVWWYSWRFLWRFVFVCLFGMCALLVKWDAFTSLELKFLVISLPGCGRRANYPVKEADEGLKSPLLNISLKPAKAIQWQIGHQNVKPKGPCKKCLPCFCKKAFWAFWADTRRFGTFWWIHCPVGQRGTFRCYTRPWFWCLAKREGAWTLDHGGAWWTGRISIDVSEQLGSLLKFVHLTSRINFRRPSDREHDLKKNHGPPEVPGFLCDFKFYIQVDEI